MPQDKRYKVEAFWDCQYCGRTGIRGRFKNCPGCGHGRDASVTFYTKDISEENAIDQEEFDREMAEASKTSRSESVQHTEAVAVESGEPSLYGRKEGEGTGDERDTTDASDWYCDFCDSYNPAAASFCSNCGAAREQSSGKTYEQEKGRVARTYDSKGNLVSERDLSKIKQHDKPEPAAQPSKNNSGCLVKVAIAAVVALLLFGLFRIVFAPKASTIEVAGFDWEQTIDIEQLQTVNENGWELPSGARLQRKDSEIRSYSHVVDHYETEEVQVPEQVIDHYETYTTEVDNGDGTFDVEEHKEPVYKTEYHTETREVPVYVDIPIFDTKYYYEIERYVKEREVTTSGNDHNPQWGEVELSGPTGAHDTGKEREGERHGTYGITDTNGNYYTADLDYWSTLEEGQKISVLIDGDGHITPKK